MNQKILIKPRSFRLPLFRIMRQVLCGILLVSVSIFAGGYAEFAAASDDAPYDALQGVLADADPMVLPFGIGKGTCYRERLNGLMTPAPNGAASRTETEGLRIGNDRMSGLISRAAMSGPLQTGALAAMDPIDRACVIMGLEFGVENAPIRWTNPHSRIDYRITPVKTFLNSRGELCRVLAVDVIEAGQAQASFASICRGHGAWSAMADG